MHLRNMRPLRQFAIVTFLPLVTTALLGCDKPASPPPANSGNAHDHHEVPAPKTLAEAVGQITKLNGEIAAAAQQDKLDDAHDQLHSIGHVLEATLKLITTSELSPEKKQAATQATDALLSHYTKVDDVLHGRPGVSYADVAPQISESLEALQKSLE